MEEYLYDFAIGLFTILKVILITLIASVRALIPNGVLPRKSVTGDVCLITGAGSGLGRMMAIEFAKLGCTLVLWDVNTKGNEETKTLLSKTGVKVHTYTVDLSNREALNATAEKVKKEVGRVDILINNAGIVTGRKIFECPDELMEKTIAVNCNANLFTAKQFIPGMLERNHGHIVTIASIAGKTGVAGLVDYCASKHGAVGYHESLTAELRHLKKDVKTTVVCPFYIDTGMFSGVVTKSPGLMPILEPAYVIECIMEAVLTEREEVQIPRFMYFVSAFLGILPSEAKHILSDYYGANDTMESFTGRKGKVA